jgi:hypothetical protein
MSIAACFAAVKKQFDQTSSELGLPPVSQYLGAQHLSDAETYNRIVWAIVGGPIKASKQAGNDKARRGRKAIRRRNVGIDVHIWGEKGDTDEARFEACESLMNHYNAAARVALTGFSWRAVDEDWTVGQQQKTAAGQLVIVRFELYLPLTFEQPLVVTGLRPAVTPQYPNT